MDQVINTVFVPLFAAQQQLTFMYDNATTQRPFGQNLANLGILVLPWPNTSLDLNPIQHYGMIWKKNRGPGSASLLPFQTDTCP